MRKLAEGIILASLPGCRELLWSMCPDRDISPQAAARIWMETVCLYLHLVDRITYEKAGPKLRDALLKAIWSVFADLLPPSEVYLKQWLHQVSATVGEGETVRFEYDRLVGLSNTRGVEYGKLPLLPVATESSVSSLFAEHVLEAAPQEVRERNPLAVLTAFMYAHAPFENMVLPRFLPQLEAYGKAR